MPGLARVTVLLEFGVRVGADERAAEPEGGGHERGGAARAQRVRTTPRST